VQAKPHIISRKEKNCYLLVNRENGRVLVVNDVGIEIWNATKEKIKVADVIEKLMKKYGVKFEDSKRETTKFVKELLRNELLAVCDF
jgi:hypothetical protein